MKLYIHNHFPEANLIPTCDVMLWSAQLGNGSQATGVYILFWVLLLPVFVCPKDVWDNKSQATVFTMWLVVNANMSAQTQL